MVFGWWRERGRKKLRAQPFPATWGEILASNVWQYRRLNDAERRRLHADVQVFVAEKHWEGVFGLEITDEIRVTIAGLACLMILGLDLSLFDRTLSILVYPNAYSTPDRFTLSGDLAIEGRSQRLGEFWYRGPIVLSWKDVLRGGRRETRGSNLVFHEFAHNIDSLNGRIVDGVPPIESADEAGRWQEVMHREYQRLIDDCQTGAPTLLDCYGTTNHGEFFAVATETFFQEPVRLERRHPELYAVLAEFYQQQPAEWLTKSGEG